MTDTAYLYQYFLENSPSAKPISSEHKTQSTKPVREGKRDGKPANRNEKARV